MNIDYLLLAAIGLFAVMGAFSGALRQLSQWVGLASAYLLAGPLGAAFGPFLAPHLGPYKSFAPIIASGFSMPAVYFAISLCYRLFPKRLLSAMEESRANRFAGFVMGTVKAGAIIYIMLSIVVSMEQPLALSGMNLKERAAGSKAVEFARKHNLFSSFHLPILESAKNLAALQSNPAAIPALFNDPALKKIISDPNIRKMFSNSALSGGAGRQNAAALLENPDMQKLLSDPELAKKL
ncbi:MAG: CvpA family protein, partial [Elusimicrobia bacterium]|nr:CvpA family protein [Elusimicrobiota bacterium]